VPIYEGALNAQTLEAASRLLAFRPDLVQDAVLDQRRLALGVQGRSDAQPN